MVLCIIPLKLVGQEGGHSHFIAEILEGGQVIKLENGFSWHLFAPSPWWVWGGESREELLAKIHTWQVGDEVTLGVWREKDMGFVSYMLGNASMQSEVPVRFYSGQTAFNSHHVEEVGWFSIKLDDGSSWDLPAFLFELFCGWNKGDPVVLYNNHRNPSYSLLVNCHASERDGKYVFVNPAQE